MTGVEAAGLVLGVLPLLISAAEHYEDVFRPFKRYRKYAPELKLYQQQLETQKTIFRNECHLLLATLTGSQTAKGMLKESKHPSWVDLELDARFGRQLGDSGSTCKTIIELIRGKLEEIEEETEKFGFVIQQSTPEGSIGDKAWRSRVGKKFKFSISEPRLEKTLRGLRKLNQDFQALARQTTRLEKAHKQCSTSVCAPPRSEQKVKECGLVQKASVQLYKALETACKMHEEHSVHFRLESQHVSIEDTGLPLIRFNMAFAHRHGGASSTLDPVWIAVDSTFDDLNPEPLMEDIMIMQNEADKALNDLSHTLKHDILLPDSSSTKRIKTKSVTFERRSPHTSSSTRTTLVTSFADPTLPDFCVQHDFCNELERCGRKGLQNRHIGYFKKSGPCKHLVYFPLPISNSSSRQTVSLAQIVSSLSQKSQTDRFLQYERLRLARQLASAVLQFHATPLLKSAWRGEDVVFFDTAVSSASLESPHLNVQVGKHNTPGVKAISDESHVPNKESQYFVRNSYLFGLGVILIELALQAPLSSLREDQDLPDGQESRHTDFFVADRLSKSMATSLGPNYAKVVRKCLGCDFGEGTTDLNDPGLQAVFYRDVVCELERLERGFMTLQLGT